MSKNIIRLKDPVDKKDFVQLEEGLNEVGFFYVSVSEGGNFSVSRLSPANFLRLLKWGAKQAGYKLVKEEK